MMRSRPCDADARSLLDGGSTEARSPNGHPRARSGRRSLDQLAGRSASLGASRAARENGVTNPPEVCCRAMLRRSHGRPGEIGHRTHEAGLLAIAATLGGLLWPGSANAAPGVANRLGGANAQGPATS